MWTQYLLPFRLGANIQTLEDASWTGDEKQPDNWKESGAQCRSELGVWIGCLNVIKIHCRCWIVERSNEMNQHERAEYEKHPTKKSKAAYQRRQYVQWRSHDANATTVRYS